MTVVWPLEGSSASNWSHRCQSGFVHPIARERRRKILSGCSSVSFISTDGVWESPVPHFSLLCEQLAMSVRCPGSPEDSWSLSSEPVVGPLPNLAFLDSYCHDTSRIFFSAPDMTIGMPFGSHQCGILTMPYCQANICLISSCSCQILTALP